VAVLQEKILAGACARLGLVIGLVIVAL